ncbi:MAG TPA: hypothetical protein PLB41_03750 [Rubrivivax sp.]|nr:hypothetical protein [Rubrivivax sp.]HPO20930.1 hypothetical protein [Rubrivivax sp.]
MRQHQSGAAQYTSDIADTYFFLRVSLGSIAVALPLVLWLGGKALLDIAPQPSISAYYHTDLRDVMVGALCAVGLALLIYKGFSRAEDWLLNIAGVLVVGVALFPTDPARLLQCFPPCAAQCVAFSPKLDRTADVLIRSGLHGCFAVGFFAAIGSVCIFCAQRTLHLIARPAVRKFYRSAYKLLGVAMWALPLTTAAWLRLSPDAGSDCADRTVFWVEAAGIWVFAAYWWLKTYEARQYGADHKYPERRAIPDALAAMK